MGQYFFFTSVGVVSLTSALVAGAIMLNVAIGIVDFECNNFVSKLPMEQVSHEKTPKVFIKGSEDTEIYFSSKDADDYCYSEFEKVEASNTKPQNRIRRTCEKKYVPLKERTKTLDDSKKEDSTENREKAAPYIKRYENRRKRIMNR